MASVELAIRLVLAATFVLAAAGKLLDLQRSRDTVVAFGLSPRLGAIGGTVLPFAEAATAISLLPSPAVRWGAVAAVVLLATFTAGVAVALSQGRTPDCNCFGVVSSEQISNRTLLRNGALIALAAIAVWQAPGSSVSSWTSNGHAANLVAVAAVLALALALVFIVQTRHQLREMRFDLASVQARRVKPGLQPSEPAPNFELATLGDSSERHRLSSLLEGGNPLLLVFASQSCGPCLQLIPELIRWNETLSERISFVLIESGVEDAGELADYISQHGSIRTLVDHDRSVNEAFQVNATPTAILVAPDGRVAAPQASGGGNIEGLVRVALELPTVPVSPVAV